MNHLLYHKITIPFLILVEIVAKRKHFMKRNDSLGKLLFIKEHFFFSYIIV